MIVCIGGSGGWGGPGMEIFPGPIFFHLHAVLGEIFSNNRLAHHFGDGVPSFSLGNPGSVTALGSSRYHYLQDDEEITVEDLKDPQAYVISCPPIVTVQWRI